MQDQLRITTLHLFPVLDKLLIELLKSLTEDEWNAQTVARLWKVKDVASHLLDGNLRGVSMSRDGYFGEKVSPVNSFQELVTFLNKLNLSWTNATKRLSPQVLIELLETTGEQYSAHLQTLNPDENALFSVAWAGQEISPNWFHIAREYTEKFLHQQQIRDAVNKSGIMTRELFYPFIDIMMYAFPHTFKDTVLDEGTIISIIVSTAIGGQWNIVRTKTGWKLNKDNIQTSDARIMIDPDTAWKLFSKSWTPQMVSDKVEITGNRELGEQALRLVAVMA